MRKSELLHAAILSGIQDTDEDWTKFKSASAGFLEVHSLSVFPPAADKERSIWIAQRIDAERGLIHESAASIIVGHSFGAHRVFDAIEHSDQIQAAVMITPAANANPYQELIALTPDQNKKREMPETPAERLLWNMALDMTDNDFSAFCERHDIARKKNRRDVNAMIRFLSEGTPFKKRLNAYAGNIPLLILQSKFDPWFIENLESPHASIVNLPEGTGHYPHISQSQFIADTVRSWLKEIGVMQESWEAAHTESREFAQTNDIAV